jgi:hypothetical protein
LSISAAFLSALGGKDLTAEIAKVSQDSQRTSLGTGDDDAAEASVTFVRMNHR